MRPPFDLQPLEESFALPGGGRLTHFPLEHRGGSVGYRLDWPGRSMAYVTDTVGRRERRLRGEDSRRGPAGPRVLLPRRPGRLGGKDRPQPHHAGGSKWPEQAGVKRLVLVHFDPLSTADDPVGLDVGPGDLPQHDLGRGSDGVGVLS